MAALPQLTRLRVQRIQGADGSEMVEASLCCSGCGRTLEVDWPGQMPQLSASRLVSPGGGEPVAGEPAGALVAGIMHRDVVCVRPDVSTESLAQLLVDRGISGAPVIDSAGRPVGMVTKTDLVRRMLDGDSWEEGDERPVFRTHQGVEVDLGPGYHVEHTSRAIVEEVMTPFVFKLPTNASVAQAAALMAYEGVHRLVVVDVDGRVAGIVSALDVSRWYARRSGYVVPEAGVGSTETRNGRTGEARVRLHEAERSVLVVDDDDDVRDAMSDLLREHGYLVTCASNGQEALDRLRDGASPRVILLDLMMPVMDGWQFLVERTNLPAISAVPVVVLSAYANPVENGDGGEIAAYLSKPVTLDRLLSVVQQHCAQA